MGRKHHNNSESCLSFCHCFLKFLLNGYFHCPQHNSTASGPPTGEGCHRESDHYDFALSSGHRFSRVKNILWEKARLEQMVRSGYQCPCWTRSSSGVRWQEADGVSRRWRLFSAGSVLVTTMFLFPDSLRKKIVCSSLPFSLVCSLNWGPELNKLSFHSLNIFPAPKKKYSCGCPGEWRGWYPSLAFFSVCYLEVFFFFNLILLCN